MDGGIHARADHQFTISGHMDNVAACKGTRIVFWAGMGRTSDMIADWWGGLRRPGVPLVYGGLVGVWLLLLTHDLTLGGWRFSPLGRDILSLLLPLIPLALLAVRIGRRELVDDGQEAFRVLLRLVGLFVATLLATGVVGLVPYGYMEDGRPESLFSMIPGRLLGLIVMVGMTATMENLMTLLRFRDRGRVSILARIYGWLLAGLLVLAQFLPMEKGEGGIGLPEAILPLSVVGAILVFILGIRISWIVNLRKKQKWGLLGLATLGFIGGALLLVLVEQSPLTPALLSHGGAFAVLAFCGAMSLLFWFMVIFVTALFALPTAEVMDRRNAEVSRMATLARLLTQSIDAADLIDSAVGIARDATSASAAWIEVGVDRGEGGVELQYGRERPLPASSARLMMDAPVPGGGTLRDAVVGRRRIQVLDRITGVHWNGAIGPPLRSAAGAPLLLGDRLLGALYLAKDRSHGFDREDVTILTALADQISLALEHSQLIRSSLERERFEQEMLIAKDLQQRLLPRVMPGSPFYELYAESLPASLVGGDYFDVVAFDDQTIGLLVGDVSGKGASAALYMGVIKGIIQALSGTCRTPGELLARANVALHGSIDQRWFVTMICAQIIEEERTLRIARAGHCPALLVRNGQGSYSRPRGIGLGIARPRLFEANLAVEEMAFLPGDYAIFISDGLPEARSPDGEEFGYDTIRAVAEEGAAMNLDPCSIRGLLFNRIEEFTRGEPPHDDSTIVVLQWR